MIAADTSVVVAAFATWHEGHTPALAALRRHRPRLPAHVVVESFSVLTRLPPPHRAQADLVAAFLRARFPAGLLTLPGSAYAGLIRETTAAGLTGGAIYDALIAATARHAEATVLSRDQRAARVYEALGVQYELIR